MIWQRRISALPIRVVAVAMGVLPAAALSSGIYDIHESLFVNRPPFPWYMCFDRDTCFRMFRTIVRHGLWTIYSVQHVCFSNANGSIFNRGASRVNLSLF